MAGHVTDLAFGARHHSAALVLALAAILPILAPVELKVLAQVLATTRLVDDDVLASASVILIFEVLLLGVGASPGSFTLCAASLLLQEVSVLPLKVVNPVL